MTNQSAGWVSTLEADVAPKFKSLWLASSSLAGEQYSIILLFRFSASSKNITEGSFTQNTVTVRHVANIYNLGRYRRDDQEEFKFILGYIMSLKPA